MLAKILVSKLDYLNNTRTLYFFKKLLEVKFGFERKQEIRYNYLKDTIDRR